MPLTATSADSWRGGVARGAGGGRAEQELPAQRGRAQGLPQRGRAGACGRRRGQLGRLARGLARARQRAQRALRAPQVPAPRQPPARARASAAARASPERRHAVRISGSRP